MNIIYFLSGKDLSTVTYYKKPQKRPEPVILPPPVIEEIKPERSSVSVKRANLVEMAYEICRYKDTDSLFPPWGAFHVMISRENIPVSKISYNPLIMAPPTDYSTIFTTLLRNKEISNALGHDFTPVVFDMGLLTKALEITWASPDELSGVIPVDGGMHLIFAVLGGVGYLYGSAGLSKLLTDSGTYAAGSVGQIIAGKDFERGIQALKYVDEVLFGLFLENFEHWARTNGMDSSLVELDELAKLLQDEFLLDEKNLTHIEEILEQMNDLMNIEINPMITRFRSESCEMSLTFKFWDSFLFRIMLPLKNYISATREGDWTTYQSSKAEFLPLLFSSGRTTYAKYLPVLILTMKRLPPDVLQAFEEGQFVSKLTKGIFKSVWLDYALETTANKDLKGGSGIVGLTLRGPALARWFLARPLTAQYSNAFKTGIEQVKDQSHHALSQAKINTWNTNVRKIKALFDNGTALDPFNVGKLPKGLLNIVTGAVSPDDIGKGLAYAFETGEKLACDFVNERLIVKDGKDHPDKGFYDTVPRARVPNMDDMKHGVQVGQDIIRIDPELMYMRLMTVNATKQVPPLRVFSFENSTVPMSLFDENGCMNTSDKAAYGHKLEELVHEETLYNGSTRCDAIVIDAGPVLRSRIPPTTLDREVTYSDMAKDFLDSVFVEVKAYGNPKQIHVAFDRYLPKSTKSMTRTKRSAQHFGAIHHVTPDGNIPRDWSGFLSRNENKTSLIETYTSFLIGNAGGRLRQGQSIYISGGTGEAAQVITKDSCTEFPGLNSNVEEADARLVAHAAYAASKGAKIVIVRSKDTDVLALLLHHRPNIPANKIYWLTGQTNKHTNNTRLVPVHSLYEKLTPLQRNLQLTVYCLSGTDTTSFFFYHGKGVAFR